MDEKTATPTRSKQTAAHLFSSPGPWPCLALPGLAWPSLALSGCHGKQGRNHEVRRPARPDREVNKKNPRATAPAPPPVCGAASRPSSLQARGHFPQPSRCSCCHSITRRAIFTSAACFCSCSYSGFILPFSFKSPTFAQPSPLSASPSCRLIANSAFSRQRRLTRIFNSSFILLSQTGWTLSHSDNFAAVVFRAHYCSPRRRRPITHPAAHSKQLAQPRAPAKTPLREVYPPRDHRKPASSFFQATFKLLFSSSTPHRPIVTAAHPPHSHPPSRASSPPLTVFACATEIARHGR